MRLLKLRFSFSARERIRSRRGFGKRNVRVSDSILASFSAFAMVTPMVLNPLDFPPQLVQSQVNTIGAGCVLYGFNSLISNRSFRLIQWRKQTSFWSIRQKTPKREENGSKKRYKGIQISSGEESSRNEKEETQQSALQQQRKQQQPESAMQSASRLPAAKHLQEKHQGFSLRSSQEGSSDQTQKQGVQVSSSQESSSNQKAQLSKSVFQEKSIFQAQRHQKAPEVPQPRKHGELAEETLQEILRSKERRIQAQSIPKRRTSKRKASSKRRGTKASRSAAAKKAWRTRRRNAGKRKASTKRRDPAESLEQSRSRKPREKRTQVLY